MFETPEAEIHAAKQQLQPFRDQQFVRIVEGVLVAASQTHGRSFVGSPLGQTTLRATAQSARTCDEPCHNRAG